MKFLKTSERVRALTSIVVLIAILTLSPSTAPLLATGSQGESDFKAFLPLIATSGPATSEPVAIPVYEYTVRVHLARFEYGTCRDITSDTLPLDAQTRIAVYRLATGAVVAEGYGQVAHYVREDEVLGFGFRTYPAEPRTLCPNLFQHRELWANVDGVYEIVDVYVYDPQ